MKYLWLLALLALSACASDDNIIPPQAPAALDERNMAGQAGLTPEDFAEGEKVAQRFAPPYDVWHGNANMIVVPEATPYGEPVQVSFSFSEDAEDPLIYSAIYVLNAANGRWKKFTLSGEGSRYFGFYTDADTFAIPAEYFGISPGWTMSGNYIAAYLCTERVPVGDGREAYACGCSKPLLNSCGKWNLQEVLIHHPATCGNNVCEPGENADSCEDDCVIAPEPPEGPAPKASVTLRITYENGDTEQMVLNINEVSAAELSNLELIPVFIGSGKTKLIINGMLMPTVSETGGHTFSVGEETVDVYIEEIEGEGGTSLAEFSLRKGVQSEVSDLLSSGETKTYVIDGTEYEVTVLSIKQSDGIATAKFLVNGEVTDAMPAGAEEDLVDGTLIKVYDVLASPVEETTTPTLRPLLVVGEKAPSTDILLAIRIAEELNKYYDEQVDPDEIDSTSVVLDKDVTLEEGKQYILVGTAQHNTVIAEVLAMHSRQDTDGWQHITPYIVQVAANDQYYITAAVKALVAPLTLEEGRGGLLIQTPNGLRLIMYIGINHDDALITFKDALTQNLIEVPYYLTSGSHGTFYFILQGKEYPGILTIAEEGTWVTLAGEAPLSSFSEVKNGQAFFMPTGTKDEELFLYQGLSSQETVVFMEAFSGQVMDYAYTMSTNTTGTFTFIYGGREFQGELMLGEGATVGHSWITLESCVIFGGIGCEDWSVNRQNKTIGITIVNDVGNELSAVTVRLSTDSCTLIDGESESGHMELSEERTFEFTCSGELPQGMFRGDLEVDFTMVGASVTHTSSGSIAVLV